MLNRHVFFMVVLASVLCTNGGSGFCENLSPCGRLSVSVTPVTDTSKDLLLDFLIANTGNSELKFPVGLAGEKDDFKFNVRDVDGSKPLYFMHYDDNDNVQFESKRWIILQKGESYSESVDLSSRFLLHSGHSYVISMEKLIPSDNVPCKLVSNSVTVTR